MINNPESESPTASDTIAVLGLGRMGTAIAARLAGEGWDVVGWTRSGRTATPDRLTTVRAANDAVAAAGVVLLALFDGPACREVLDQVHGSLRRGAVVVNTSTIAPAEATALARRLGPAYVHAPVLGSVRAVASGSLTILTGTGTNAGGGALGRVRPVLDALGTVRHTADAASAAALKLIVNSGLAGAMLALRDSLQQADAMGLPRGQVLDVLELGQLGGLVARKRALLDGAPGPAGEPGEPAAAEFTIGALAKDMALLARATNTPLRSAAELSGSSAGPDADIALAATDRAPGDDVLEPLRAYIRGHATGDPAHFRRAFLPGAHIEGLRDGAFVSWRLDDYCAMFDRRPAPDEPTRFRRIDAVDIRGTVATATMTLWHGADTFTDMFLLAHVDGRWRIANKVYHRSTQSGDQALSG